MTRAWERQELDLKILESLYDVKALIGRTVVKIYTSGNEQRGYDRLHALKKRGLVEGIPYCEVKGNGRKENLPGKRKKRATLYYLTADGVRVAKKLKKLEIDGAERSMRPEEEQLIPLYFASLLAENIPLKFYNAKEFKLKNRIPNFVTLDLICGDWLIIIEREQNNAYRRNLCKQVKGLRENPACGNILILCHSELKRTVSIQTWKKEYGPTAHFMVKDNYNGIYRLLSGNTTAEIIKTIEQNKGPVQMLTLPVEGFTHIINGKRSVIIDLIGFPVRSMRHLSGVITPNHNPHIGVESVDDLKAIVRCFPEILRPGFEFFTLDGVTGTSEAISRLYSRKE
ncbi:hypothetical protein [Bacteroides sp.]|uniref:hypothetical protein n=1 Tax=Bacteroides sp. TaxID=29523 RepID=UPI00261D9954|nr:hypothetical protein [Bacteroides sp.]MDD3040403.1 hypothetical protein [Bacteroides sp.]